MTTIDSTAAAGCLYCAMLTQCLYGLFDAKDIRDIDIPGPNNTGFKSKLMIVNLVPQYQLKDGGKRGYDSQNEEEILLTTHPVELPIYLKSQQEMSTCCI